MYLGAPSPIVKNMRLCVGGGVSARQLFERAQSADRTCECLLLAHCFETDKISKSDLFVCECEQQ
jgi:hypothetical protein